ncbi:hypothetical protein [Kitasatospora sp. DSM 101779]|uniref:hypothetical protein n=1 Tax=Kitasatospora sp. DSM 101779 TaxID=2853165 RepID=UPI0021DA10F2|nr:hypothetical protein [Kitasatospora sp. DSM 101779]MCU7824223.1 hypothetical protein [Kitasatospora sp. DSM 101779]
MVQESGYGVVWKRPGPRSPPLADCATALGRRPYDLRHAGISLGLNSGGDPTEIAHRAGHSVAVILRVYAKCLHGTEDDANELISQRLARGSHRPAGRRRGPGFWSVTGPYALVRPGIRATQGETSHT